MTMMFYDSSASCLKLAIFTCHLACVDEASHESLLFPQNVAAFAISAGAYNWDRMMKPFNPLLGETYELHRDGFK